MFILPIAGCRSQTSSGTFPAWRSATSARIQWPVRPRRDLKWRRTKAAGRSEWTPEDAITTAVSKLITLVSIHRSIIIITISSSSSSCRHRRLFLWLCYCALLLKAVLSLSLSTCSSFRLSVRLSHSWSTQILFKISKYVSHHTTERCF